MLVLMLMAALAGAGPTAYPDPFPATAPYAQAAGRLNASAYVNVIFPTLTPAAMV